mgnify:CR=1 FL=1
MDNLENECPGTANAAEAEKKKVAADLGKFKDVKALLDAYNSLEAEFTRRSQRLRELESNKAENPPAQAASGEPSAHTQNSASLYEAAAGDEEVKTKIIADYLKSVSSAKGAPMVTGGIVVTSPKTRPASIKEAGRLAQEFFNGNFKQ